MPMLNVFDDDIFGVVSLTAAINRLPFKAGRLGEMGLFKRQGITTTQVAVEFKDGKLALIPTAARGTMPNVNVNEKRKMYPFIVPHIPLNDAIYAADIQNVRAFGSDSEVDAVTPIVNNKLESMRQSHEVTLEYHRIGAIQGVILDADGMTEVVNFFDRFGITENEIDFDLANDDIKLKALEVIRLVGRLLGATPYSGIHAMCGDNFFDNLISNPTVKSAFEVYQFQGNPFGLNQQNGSGGFEFAGITWENYTGYVGDREFIDTDTCRFFPTGVPELFSTWDAPADFIETVNTVGVPVYVKQETMAFDKGIQLHSQSNPLNMCTRPSVLIKGNDTSGSSESE